MANDKDKTPATTSSGSEPTVTAPEGQGQMQLQINEDKCVPYYSSTARVWGSAEEIIVDLAQGIQPTGKNTSVMRIDARVIMSPWAAKRLALALSQAVQRYEQAYGVIEIDPRRRMKAPPPSTTQAS